MTLELFDLLMVYWGGQLLLALLMLMTRKVWAPRAVLSAVAFLVWWPVYALLLCVAHVLENRE